MRRILVGAAVAASLFGIVSCSLLEGPMAKAKGDNMPVTHQLSARDAVSKANEAMEKLPFNAASVVVFSLLSETLPFNDRSAIIGSYAKKYGNNALLELKKQVSLVGASKEQFSNLSATRQDFMKSLSYGIALFGIDGFNAALDILNGQNDYSLAAFISVTTVQMLIGNGFFSGPNQELATSRITSEIEKRPPLLSTLLRFLRDINNPYFCSLKSKGGDIGSAVKLVEIRDSTPCKR